MVEMVIHVRSTHGRVVIAVGGAGLLLAAVAAALVEENDSSTYPYTAWTQTERLTWWLAILSAAVLTLAGAWLLWRLPRNPTGWWVSAAGAAMALWIIGTFSSTSLSPWLRDLLPPVFKAAIVVAVLRWPTGRLPSRWERPLAVAVAAYIAVGVATAFSNPGFLIPDAALPALGDPITGLLVRQVTAVLLVAVAPALFVAAMLRRRASMPPGVRATAAPAFAAAVLIGAAELWTYGSILLRTPLEGHSGTVSTVGALRYVVDFGRFAVVAALLVWSETMRRRAAGLTATTATSIELAPVTTTDARADIALVVGDPSARLELRKPDRPWPEPDPALGAGADGARSRIEVVDGDGRTIAVVDHSTTAEVSRVSRDAVMASIGLAVVRSARQVAAEERRRELQQAHRRVLDAQDRARRRLERDLHDGVQQRLVALALDASLLARRESTHGVTDEEREVLIESIDRSVQVIRDLLAGGTPGVLDPGLAAGLLALEATVPLPTTVTLDGDLRADHPAAVALWFVASEAVANALKHADARSLTMGLRIDDERAELVVADDGCGGVVAVPDAIVDRLDGLPANVALTSPVGGGTAILVSVDLAVRVGVR